MAKKVACNGKMISTIRTRRSFAGLPCLFRFRTVYGVLPPCLQRYRSAQAVYNEIMPEIIILLSKRAFLFFFFDIV